MSTFDTMCDWEEGLVSDAEAIAAVLQYHAMWCPEAEHTESFQALCRLAIALKDKETKAAEDRFKRLFLGKHPKS